MRRAVTACLIVLLLAAAAAAQDYLQWERGFQRSAPPRFPTATSFDGSFSFCRLYYSRVRSEYGGQGWWTDYPDADTNFSIRLSELTKTRVSQDPDGEPNHLVVRADSPEIFECPFVTIEDAGTAQFTDAEVKGLREYLLKGGFLWSDDFWGDYALECFSAQLARVFPEMTLPEKQRKYELTDVPLGHPVFRMMFEMTRIPQIPSIQHWRRSGGETSERGFESEHVNFKGISDTHGRLMVLMTHNTDIADAWEREGEDQRFFFLFSPEGYAVGINILLYAYTH
jgi:uncharacterized protein DUF4159